MCYMVLPKLRLLKRAFRIVNLELACGFVTCFHIYLASPTDTSVYWGQTNKIHVCVCVYVCMYVYISNSIILEMSCFDVPIIYVPSLERVDKF